MEIPNTYPVYVRKPGQKKSIIERWEPQNQKQNYYRAIAALIIVVVVVFVILLIIFMVNSSKCKNAFCRIVENAQHEINSKIIVK